MGLYLCLTDITGLINQPDWQFGLAGDRDLASLLIELPQVRSPQCGEEDTIFRLTDFDLARESESRLDQNRPNPGRWRALIDRLEANPHEWVCISW